MKLLILVLVANITLASSAFAAFTCQQDNKLVLPPGSYCCCVEDTTTPAKDYICSIKPVQCTSSEIPVGMKEKDETKICPCTIKFTN